MIRREKHLSGRKKAAVILISVGGLLILAAAAFAGYNIWDDYRAGKEAASALKQLDTGTGASDKWLDPDREMPTVEIDGYRYIGKITIPAIGIDLPVMQTWDYKRMKKAPCRYSGTAYKKNFVICGHNYAAHFGRLKNLAAGDSVTFTDVDGNVFHYEVEKTETLAPTAVAEMTSGGWALSLFTCNLSGRARVTVRCRKAG